MDHDIESCYERYKERVGALETDPENGLLKSEVAEDFRCLYELIKMLMIMKKERLYGHFLLNINMVVDFDFRSPAGVTMDTMPFTMRVNPVRMSRYSIRQIIFILCHEIEHLILNHPVEARRINKEKDPHNDKVLNVAMDASINDRLIDEVEEFDLKIMEFPGDGITSEFLSMLFEKEFQSLREFTYYYYNFPSKKRVLLDDIDVCDHDWSNNDDLEGLESAIRLFARNVADGMSEEDKMKLSPEARELLRKLMEPPKIRWQDILRRYVGSVPDGFRKSKARLNRRQPDRFDVSGRLRSRTVKLVVAIDTSGSMSVRQLEEIFVEIFSILKNTNHEVTVIECDCEVGRVYTARNMADVDPHISGRGGTEFTPVINYVNSEGRFRDAVLIYFTDGMGEERIPRPMTYRNLWVLSSEDGYYELSVKEPYGDVVQM